MPAEVGRRNAVVLLVDSALSPRYVESKCLAEEPEIVLARATPRHKLMRELGKSHELPRSYKLSSEPNFRRAEIRQKRELVDRGKASAGLRVAEVDARLKADSALLNSLWRPCPENSAPDTGWLKQRGEVMPNRKIALLAAGTGVEIGASVRVDYLTRGAGSAARWKGGQAEKSVNSKTPPQWQNTTSVMWSGRRSGGNSNCG